MDEIENNKLKILAVDDEEINLDILNDDLTYAGYEVLCAGHGQQALELLGQNQDVTVILLDRMMPIMDGMELTKRLKQDERYKNIPIIMQTGAALPEQVKEGIEAGVYYYLTKPYNEDILLAIVSAAINDVRKSESIRHELNELQTDFEDFKTGLHNLANGTFEFRRPDEIRSIAFILASGCPDPNRVIIGITEVMLNAIEHGNLEINFDDKTKLMMADKLRPEIDARLNSTRYENRRARIEMKRNANHLEFIVTDEGNGFAWEEYMQISPERATRPNGRGIAMANMFSFDEIKYIGCGNKVICTVNL